MAGRMAIPVPQPTCTGTLGLPPVGLPPWTGSSVHHPQVLAPLQEARATLQYGHHLVLRASAIGRSLRLTGAPQVLRALYFVAHWVLLTLRCPGFGRSGAQENDG
ncbi:hypothetical protein NDU88_006445 [Pleurodeles waltl]|uniref:Uncharacterized protein n=1 Tax=Pleurodeles waltl TaxID=8319 RepID=A0AAV7MCZ9_PLEWA|nr:hypothetical protein NDU88_006445 [Pleurodeles waltl]